VSHNLSPIAFPFGCRHGCRRIGSAESSQRRWRDFLPGGLSSLCLRCAMNAHQGNFTHMPTPRSTLRAVLRRIVHRRAGDWAPEQQPLPVFSLSSLPRARPHGVTLLGDSSRRAHWAARVLALERMFGVSGESPRVFEAFDDAQALTIGSRIFTVLAEVSQELMPAVELSC